MEEIRRTGEMIEMDRRHARLLSLALKAIGEDVEPLVLGAEISEDPLDAGCWLTDGEKAKEAEFKKLFEEFRQKLEELGCRALVYLASNEYLSSDPQKLILDLSDDEEATVPPDRLN